MQNSVLKQIYDCLKKDGFDVYFPSQHKGECNSPYIVIRMAGVYNPLTVSSERPLYDILIYVPENRYSILETIIYDTKQSLKKLYPMIEYNGTETATYYDESVKANMVSFQYQGIRKKENM